MKRWSEKDQERALCEGWAIFNMETRPEIQKNDESAKLPDDSAAEMVVLRKAAQGSAFHMRALAVVGTTQTFKKGEYLDADGKHGPCVWCKRRSDNHEEDFKCFPPAPKGKARRAVILAKAKEWHENEGELEIDSNAKISEGDDNGAYVQAWVWVDFDGTPLSKE